jgi:hypothetical protein
MRMRAPLGCLAACLALAFSGCSYLLGDPYGNYLQKTEGWVDLRESLQTATGKTLERLNAMDVVEGSYLGSTYRHVFLKCDFADKTSRVRSLGYDDFSLSSFDDSPSGPEIFSASQTISGDIRIGNTAYRGDLGSIMWSGLASPSWSAWTIHDGVAASNLVYSDAANSLHIDRYDTTWGAQSTLSWQISSASGPWLLARAKLLADGRVVLLFFAGMGGEGTIRGASFANFASLYTAASAGTPALMESSDASLSDPVHVYSPDGSNDRPPGISAWLTQAGLVSLTDQGNNNSFTFRRFPYGPGKEMDKYTVSANHDELFFFEASGRYWYRFDRGTGKLFRLRTWW